MSPPPLRVNDGLLPSSATAPLRPSLPSTSLSILRHRYSTDGYLFLKHLLPRADVLAAREAYFSLLLPSGVLKPGTAPVEGIFDAQGQDALDFPGIGAGSIGGNGRPGGEKAACFVDLALQAHSEQWYAGKDGLAQHSVLYDFVARLTAWAEDTLVVKRSLLRNNTPGNRAIGVHYDQIFLRHGEPTSVTAWVPMGDISLQGGGLIYLEDSDSLGQQIEAEFTKRAKAAGMSLDERRNAFNSHMMSTGFLADGPAEFGRQHQRRWLVTEYEAGDVVLHSPHMIHASTINEDADNRIRLGTDLRFVNSAKTWDTRWANTFCFDDGV
ncbi:hypothetical protein CDD81_2890 [Ophiocordyceps australis]|uniref:Phytanoyl-CoA hydroxylase n=1 Tax=Ophiocordyceps australis TaxID=1399860 RepID=A0A2C5XEB8_9HYPO|nr:hypothetical protein CDD81_2890 [Ophiocordyceps australis]